MGVMNLLIQIYLAFEDTNDVFNNLMNDISDVLEEYKYVNTDDDSSSARSLIVVKQNEETDVSKLIKDSILVILPIESDKNAAKS
jgi:hypothetical protein